MSTDLMEKSVFSEKKILIINTYFYPDLVGGTEISVYKLSQKLAINHHVNVICTGNADSFEKINGIGIYRIKKIKKTKGEKIRNNLLELYNFKILDKCDQIINKIEPDIVHTNNLYHISLGIWRIIKKKKICVIHTVRDQYLTQSHSKIKNWLFKLMTRYVDYLTSPSNFTLQHFLDRNYFPKVKKSVRIFNSNFIDYDYFNRCRKKKLHREGSLNFAYLGRYSPEKGVLFLLDTFKRYNENNNNRLILFGKGILEERINQVIELWPNIVNKGYLEEKDLYYNLEEIDVLIVPSICDEVFGRVVIDAYQCAIPVIASRKGGLPEIVHDRHTGELFSANNSDELIKLMKKFEDRSLLNKYIDNIPTYLKDYDIQKQEHEFLELYKKACQMQSL